MRISRLDLFGFKSFVDRTTFHFEGGVSCVVGPNGSGKSNVVDALRWCIGEQSPKSLRGSEMSDVIFAGSADRRPVGFAEVQLTLVSEGAEDPFPGDFAALAEVQIGRRLHRTGASEYLINQSRVRRKDVVELLMDSGIGNNLYSFIEQGQIDKAVTASPEERRSVIDEAAGIARYKARRAEARVRLEATSAQLDRASDVIEEMRRRLRSLERQVVRAAQFRRCRTRIRLAELQLALAKVQDLMGEQRQLREQQRSNHGKEGLRRGELATLEAQLQTRRGELEVVEASVTTHRDRTAELDAHIREQTATRRLHEQRREELTLEALRAEEELKRAAKETAGADTEATELLGAREASRQQLQQLQEQVEEVRTRHTSARDEARAAREAAEEAEAELQEVVRSRMEDEATRASLQARLEGLDQRAAQLAEQLARLEAGAEAAIGAEEAHQAACAPAAAALQQAQAQALAAEAAWREAGEHQEAAEAALSEALRERQRRWDEARAEADGIQRRGRAWADAAEVAERRALDALEARWRGTLQAAEAGSARQLAERVAAARAEAEAVATAKIEAIEAQLVEARATRDATIAAVDAAQGRLDQVESEGRTLARRRAEVEARLAGARARLAPDAGALEGLPRLLDQVEPAARPGVLDRLGHRALQPVITDPGILLELAGGLGTDGGLQAWFRPGGGLPAAARAPWAPSLAEGLAQAASGGAVAGPGFRVDAEGWLELGATGDLSGAAEEEQRLSAEAAELEAARGALQDAREQGFAELESAREARRAADVAWQQAATGAEAERAAARRAVVDQEGAAREAARQAADAEQRALAQQQQQQLEEARRARTVRIERVRREVEAAIQALSREAEPEDAGGAIEAMEARTRDARRIAAEAGTARDAARTAALEAAHQLERAEAALQAAIKERVRLVEEGAGRRAEVAGLDADRQAASAQLAEAMASLQRHAQAEEEVREAVSARRVEAAVASRDEEAAAQAVAAVEQAMAGLRETAAGLEARAEATVARRATAAESAQRARTRAEEAREGVVGATAARDEAEAALARATEERGTSWDTLERERARLKELKEALGRAEREHRTLRRTVEDLSGDNERLASRSREIQGEIERVAHRMDERYQQSVHLLLDQLYREGRLELEVDEGVAAGLTIGKQTIEGVPPLVLYPEDLTEEEAVLAVVRGLEADRARLQSIGDVNLAALEEYRELSERYEQLETQREDLEESIRSIRAAIAKMNRICRERFREAFDQVKDHFHETYPRLVGGGSARLALTDEEDLLESGVDIFVQPPGKRLQNLGLLSGGEKAMTAIALLIALFRVKPSPFCVLDEVDAPLDEANGARFNEMLKEMSARSQFLVITHNRKTMECADTLYGITMAKPGVSRLVSVRM